MAFTPYTTESVRNITLDRQNLEERLRMHNERTLKHCYTSRFHGGWVVIYQEYVASRQEALVRERQLESYRGREFIKQHIPR